MNNITRKILSFALALAMIVPMFVFPSAAADTAPELITSIAGYSNIEVRVTTDKDPLSYRIGDKVTFTMKVYADNVHVTVPMIKVSLEGDGSDSKGVAKLLKYFDLYPDENGVFTLTHDVISIPGYMRLEGNIYSSSTGSAWAETPNNDRARTIGAGILVNYEEITTVMPEPADFDTVWAERLADLEAVAPKIVRIDKVTTWYSGTTKKTANANFDVYALYIDCPGSSGDVLLSDAIGNQKDATWAVGYITVPKNKTDGSLSVSQGYQGYGINTATPSENTGAIAINMATHSVVLLNNENAAPASEYKSKYTSYIKNGTKYGYDATDNSKIETCYFANLLLRDLQMLRFAKQAFGTTGAASLIDDTTVINGMTKAELLTAMEYWKGLYNGKISTSGGSQGGFQAIGVGAFEEDVTAVSASIPWMGDTHIDTDSQRLHGGSTRPTPGEGIRYCDTAFLVRRVEAPVTILARLVDKSCVPNGMISIWNNLVDSKKDVDGYMGAITWIQSGTHGYQPAYPENPTQVLRTYELVEPTGIPNSEGGFTKSGYVDIDGYTVDQDALPPSTGYIQIGTNTKANATVAQGFSPSLYYQGGANVYYNAELKKLVYVTTGNISADYGKHSASASQNTNVVGNTWYVAYWASQNNLDIKDIEFRYGTGGSMFSGFGYVTSVLTAAQTVKYDTRLNGCSWGGSSSAGAVVGMTSLKSLGHGTFSSEGKFTSTTYKDGVVNLTGFTNFSKSHWNYILYNCASVEEVVTHTLAASNMFEGCSLLKKVTIPAAASLTAFGANNFKNCNKLEKIEIGCDIPSVAVGANAFNGKEIVITVMTAEDKETMDAALKTAGINNITVVVTAEDTSALSADGFSVRTEDYTGLRSIFSFDSNLLPYYASSGLTLSEYGALMMSSDNFESVCDGDEKAMYDLGVAGTSPTVKYIPVYKMVDGVQKGRNKYLSVEDGIYTYCVTLTDIPEVNYKDDVYVCAYVKWVDAGGNETLEFVHYTDSLGQDARSLYDVTAAAYKLGVVNSTLAPDFDTIIWPVLEKGAVTLDSFKYLDVPYYEYTWYTDNTLTTPATDINGGLNYCPGNETPTESGIVWSLIEYGNEYIATYRLADGAEPTTLPRLTYINVSSGHTVFQPFDSRFNGASGGKNFSALEPLSPTLASANAALVTTLVIDSGITGANTYSLAYMPTIKTLVMPEDFKSFHNGVFHGCTNLTTAYTAGRDVAENVIDLSALDTITSLNWAFTDCSSAVNIKLPADVPLRNAYASFKNCKKLERVWVDGNAMPEKGVIDLSNAPSLAINSDMMKNAALINTLICPDETTLSSVGCLISVTAGTGASNPYGSTVNVNIEFKTGSAAESAIKANLTNDQFTENKIALNGIAITNTGDLEIDFSDAW